MATSKIVTWVVFAATQWAAADKPRSFSTAFIDDQAKGLFNQCTESEIVIVYKMPWFGSAMAVAVFDGHLLAH